MTFRFDDVCKANDAEFRISMTNFLFKRFPGCQIIWAISPLVKSGCGQRVYPAEWNALSDYKCHYKLDTWGCILGYPAKVTLATHGLVHCDHRLLTKEAQEMSILLSASLIGAKTFVPPFNKWNKNTEDICNVHNIELIKFEDGWKCMEYNKWDSSEKLWYLHAREWTINTFKAWFNG